MAGNGVLQILRGTRDKIVNNTDQLLPGQLLYNMTDNFLYCGKADTQIQDLDSLYVRKVWDSKDNSAYVEAKPHELSIYAHSKISIATPTCIFSSNADFLESTTFKGTTKSEVRPSTENEVVRLKELQDLDLTYTQGNGFIKSITQTDGLVTATHSDVALTLHVTTAPTISNTSTDVVRGAELAALDYTLTAADGFINSVSQVDGKIAATTTTITKTLQVTTAPTNDNDVVRWKEIDGLDLAQVSGNGFIKTISQNNGKIVAETSDTALTLNVTSTPTQDNHVLRNQDVVVNNKKVSDGPINIFALDAEGWPDTASAYHIRWQYKKPYYEQCVTWLHYGTITYTNWDNSESWTRPFFMLSRNRMPAGSQVDKGLDTPLYNYLSQNMKFGFIYQKGISSFVPFTMQVTSSGGGYPYIDIYSATTGGNETTKDGGRITAYILEQQFELEDAYGFRPSY